MIAKFGELLDTYVAIMIGDDDFTVRKTIQIVFDSNFNNYTGEWMTEDGVSGEWKASICK